MLLVNLAVSAMLSTRFLTGHGTFHRLERWQTTYLPVFALWAAAVVVILPTLLLLRASRSTPSALPVSSLS